MLNENAKLWVEDLRKNRDLQGRRRLHIITDNDEERFCCLGRGCVLYNENNPDDKVFPERRYAESYLGKAIIAYDDQAAVLPHKVKIWLGIRTDGGMFKDKEGNFQALTALNDRGKSFAEIADIIESEPEGLFV